MGRCGTLGETAELAFRFAGTLKPGDIVLLCGELGAGKTTFTRSMAEALGIQPDIVSSPTFTLMNVYPGQIDLVHVDFYRLLDGGDIFFDELEEMADGTRIIVIEWGDRFLDQIRDWAPGRLFLVRFSMISDEERDIQVEEDSHH